MKSLSKIVTVAIAASTLAIAPAMAGSWGWRSGNTGRAGGEGATKAAAYSDLESAAYAGCRGKGFNKTPDIGAPEYQFFNTNPRVRAFANVTCYK